VTATFSSIWPCLTYVFISLHICWETKGNDRLKSILQVGASVPNLIPLPHALMHSYIRWSRIHLVVFFISFRHVSFPSCHSCILHVNHVSLLHESCLFLLESCLLPIASSNDRTIMCVRHAYHIYQHTYENVEHRRANQPRLFTRAFDQTAVLTIIESKRASLLNYKQASRDPFKAGSPPEIWDLEILRSVSHIVEGGCAGPVW